MENNTLIAVRSNCNFALDYKTGHLTPQAEVILIVTHPQYHLNEDQTAFTNEPAVKDIRFHAGAAEINKLIGELQILLKNINNVDQMSHSWNTLYDANKEGAK